MSYQSIIELISRIIELFGVATILMGAAVAIVRFLKAWASDVPIGGEYPIFRQRLGRSILLGLEFLLGGEIIRSIAVQPTIIGVVVLAIIVLVRSFLTMELEMEVTGRWPWQKKSSKSSEER